MPSRDYNLICDSNYISDEIAAGVGCREGHVPKDYMSAQSYLKTRHQSDPFCSPINLSGDVEVFDFTEKYEPNRALHARFGIGRYNEDRKGMYQTDLFQVHQNPRTIHVGLDIGAAQGTPVFAPLAGEIWGIEYLQAEGDYGGAIILKSESLFMLFGHLSKLSVLRFQKGKLVSKGDLLGWLGVKTENGGWNPHLHWQLSFLEPRRVDMPGAVSKENRELAMLVFPDPTELLRLAIAGWN